MYRPTLIGSYPLDVQIHESKIKFLVTWKNLKEYRVDLHKLEFTFENFIINDFGASFTFKGVAIELIGTESGIEKTAEFRCLLVKEKVLSIGGKSFKDKVIHLKLKGMHTDDAFKRLLNLRGEAPECLLRLEEYNDLDFKKLILKP